MRKVKAIREEIEELESENKTIAQKLDEGIQQLNKKELGEICPKIMGSITTPQ